jgi:phosphatidylglycerophosphatase A
MSRPVNFSFMKEHPLHWVALGFGSGLSPQAPGTVGTLVGIPLHFLISLFPDVLHPVLLVGCFLLGVVASEKTAHALKAGDPSAIVWDEVVAFALVLEITPATPWGYLLAFMLFRLFDIWKPFPIRWMDQHIHGGLGIMLDDLLAACYAMLSLWHLRKILHVDG